jgi:hypothetical protein
MRRTLPAAIGGLIILSTAGFTAPHQTGPAWAPEKSISAKLGKAVVFGDYTLRPPAGYTLHKQPGPDGAVGYAWVADARADNTRDYIMVALMQVPKSDEKRPLDNLLQSVLNGIAMRRTNFKASNFEYGTLDGIPFARAHWSGAVSDSGLKMHGFAYVALDGHTLIDIASQDVDPYAKTTLPLTEASAQTLRKRGAGSVT